MPSVDENVQAWNDTARWFSGGDDWSTAWGGVEAQWFGCLYPRARHYLPTGTVLEIAPGYGRWTQFLRQQCNRLIGVDLSPGCVDACRERFSGDDGTEFHVNDGRSLSMVEDHSVDFAFSFDSLVHAEADVLGAYIDELARVLRDDGLALLHHSNLGAYRRYFSITRRVPAALHSRLRARGVLDHDHWRAMSVTADSFARRCDEAALSCTHQEVINWGTKRLIDCISVIRRRSAAHSRRIVVANPHFMQEAESIRLAAAAHAPPAP